MEVENTTRHYSILKRTLEFKFDHNDKATGEASYSIFLDEKMIKDAGDSEKVISPYTYNYRDYFYDCLDLCLSPVTRYVLFGKQDAQELADYIACLIDKRFNKQFFQAIKACVDEHVEKFSWIRPKDVRRINKKIDELRKLHSEYYDEHGADFIARLIVETFTNVDLSERFFDLRCDRILELVNHYASNKDKKFFSNLRKLTPMHFVRKFESKNISREEFLPFIKPLKEYIDYLEFSHNEMMEKEDYAASMECQALLKSESN